MISQRASIERSPLRGFDSTKMKLTTIVPRILPVVDGIGEYALSLACVLRNNSGIETQFIVTDPQWTGDDQVERFEVQRLSSHSANEMLGLLRGDSDSNARVLLHYEGYGYANRGCPFWLVDAMEQWRSEGGKRSFATMFHELYATGLPWTSAFWLSRFQKELATRLARLSDQCLTSLESYGRVVREMRGNVSAVSSLPVFSSIGEPKSPPPLEGRRRRLVNFGTRGRRIEVYRRSAGDLNRICDELGIEEIVDIGQPMEFDISSAVAVPVILCGELPSSEVSELLLDSVAGVIDYPAAMLGKSTIFAAYCSHRVMPVVANNGNATPSDGLEAIKHYWLTSVEPDRLGLANGQGIADNALAWYQTHSLAAHADRLAACLGCDTVSASSSSAAVECVS